MQRRSANMVDSLRVCRLSLSATLLSSLVVPLVYGATPSSGTLTATSGSSASRSGDEVAATFGESTCVNGTNCDVYTLNLSGTTSSYVGKYVTVKLTWSIIAD